MKIWSKLFVFLLAYGLKECSAQNENVTYLFYEWNEKNEYLPPQDSLRKWRIHKVEMRVRNEDSIKSPLDSYTYHFDRKYRLVNYIKTTSDPHDEVRKTRFRYKRQNRIKSMILEVNKGDFWHKYAYSYRYQKQPNGLTKVMRTKRDEQSENRTTDSVYFEMNKKGQLLQLIHYWSGTPSRLTQTFKSAGDTAVVVSTLFDVPTYHPEGTLYDRKTEVRECVDQHGRLILREYRAINLKMDCPVGLPLFERWNYDAAGRLRAVEFESVGERYRLYYQYNPDGSCIVYRDHEAVNADFLGKDHHVVSEMNFGIYPWPKEVKEMETAMRIEIFLTK